MTRHCIKCNGVVPYGKVHYGTDKQCKCRKPQL